MDNLYKNETTQELVRRIKVLSKHASQETEPVRGSYHLMIDALLDELRRRSAV